MLPPPPPPPRVEVKVELELEENRAILKRRHRWIGPGRDWRQRWRHLVVEMTAVLPAAVEVCEPQKNCFCQNFGGKSVYWRSYEIWHLIYLEDLEKA